MNHPCCALVSIAALIAVTSAAEAFSILGTNAAYRLSSSLMPGEMFRYNGLPTMAGEKTIRYRLDPNLTAPQMAAINAAFATWDGKLVAQPNTTAGVFGNGDLESLVLHEIGHALGLAHSGNREDLVNGVPVNRFFDTDANRFANNPFNAMVNPDITNLQQSANRPTVANYNAFVGPGFSSAVMTYESFLVPGQQTQRRLEFDDAGGMAFGEAGRDNMAGTGDDFRYRLMLDAGNPNGVDRDVLRTAGGRLLPLGADERLLRNQHRGGTIDVFSFNPFFFNPRNPRSGNGVADMVYDRDGRAGNGAFSLIGGDVYLNIPGELPERNNFRGTFTHTVPACAGANVCNGLGTASFNTGVAGRTPFNVGFDFFGASYPVEPQGVFSVGVLSVRNGETFFGTTPEFPGSHTFFLNLHVEERTDGILGSTGDLLLGYWSSPNAFPGLRNPRNADVLYAPLRPDLGAVRILEGNTLANAVTNVSLLCRRGSLDFEGFFTDFEFTDLEQNGFTVDRLPTGMVDPDTGYFMITAPEPASLSLFLLGVAALAVARRPRW